jgi:CubicO group peptidase (beta-lactamase class C family)
LDEARGGQVARTPVFEAGAGGLVSMIDDMAAFGQMMLKRGVFGRERILSRPSVELMTTDHLTPEQKAASPFFANFWDGKGWGFGMEVITGRNDLSSVPGRFGWDGAFGTSWHVDPGEEMVGILMTQRRPDRLDIPALTLDFWTSAYQLIDD